MNKIAPFLFCALLLIPNLAHAEKKKVIKTVTTIVEEEVDDKGATIPSSSKFGLYGSVLGDPGVNLFGINLAYQMSDDWRLDVGFGTMLSVANSFGVDVRYYFPTGSRFKPFFGLGLTEIFVNSSNLTDSTTVNFPNFTIIYPSIKVGLEYQAPSGFFVSLHFSGLFMLYSGASNTFAVDPLPSLSIGSFF